MNTITITNRNHQIKNLPLKCNSSSISESGLSLVSSTGDSKFQPNILESSPPCLFPPTKKRIGFLDDIGGGVDGLMSCTESLGFESSDERRVDTDIDGYKFNNNVDRDDHGSCLNVKPWISNREKWRKMGERREVKKYPPPLSSLNQNGKPCFILKPVRKDGRLELTEVKIHRPEILKAHREDGRLRLHFIRDDEDEDENEVEEDEENDEELEQEELEQVEEVIKTEQEKEDKIIEEEEERLGKWRFGVNGERFRRCHEVLNHHQVISHRNHHHLPVWSQQCVTTR